MIFDIMYVCMFVSSYLTTKTRVMGRVWPSKKDK